MLKNIAIPLMLAATEAEAQKKPSKDEVAAAMMMDKAKEFRGLQADAAACTVESSTAENNIANLAQDVSDAQTALDTLKGEAAALIADGGAWFNANEARKTAVQAAVDEELKDAIKDLLDANDTAAEAERAAAQAYVDADRAFVAGTLAATNAQSRLDTATARKGVLSTKKDNSANAKSAADTQINKEKLWREWRYCELGASVTNASTAGATAPGTNWWNMLTSQASIVAAPTVEPTYCTVPGVPDGCVDEATGTPLEVVCTRKSTKYYGKIASSAPIIHSDDLSVEADDGTQLWTADLKRQYAILNENATSIFYGQDRQKAGQVAWYTGDLRRLTWLHMQRTKESAFYNAVIAKMAAALGAAVPMNNDKTYDIPAQVTGCDAATPPAGCLWSNGMGTFGGSGAMKALDASSTARDAAGAGHKSLPGLRGAGGVATDANATAQTILLTTSKSSSGNTTLNIGGTDGWKSTFTIDSDSLTAWTTANASAGNVHTWWVAAAEVSVAADAWWTAYTGNHAKFTAGTVGPEAAVTCTGGTNDGSPPDQCQCDTAQANGGTWTANAADTIADCKSACETYTIAGLLETDANVNGTGFDNLGTNGKFAKFSADGQWCGAYSFLSTGASGSSARCKLLYGATGATSTNNTPAAAANGADVCFDMDMSTYATAQKLVRDKYVLLTAALYDNLVTDIDTQVGLEKSWLEAWYLQQYWVAIAHELHETTADSKRAAYKAMREILVSASTAVTTSIAGAELSKTTGETQLVTATNALAVLQSATAVAQASVAALGTRILRADAQIQELEGLVATDGALAKTAAMRLEDYNTYDAGEFAAATSAKSLADAAVATTTGALWIAKDSASTDWTSKTGLASTARQNLTDGLGAANLETLRAQVASDTDAWNTQQLALTNKRGEIANQETAVETAEGLRDAAVLACQIDAYDTYRTTLEAEQEQRLADLKTIKELMETQLELPAPGTEGARCEKALSNGTFRPKRGPANSCGGEESGLCCGAARVWMESGTTADAAWRTIETCQLETADSYDYQPPRAPMATTMPAKVSADFTCIEGAKKLAAAASAVAAAVYMLA